MLTPSHARRISFGIRHLLIFVALAAIALGTWNWFIRWHSVSISGSKITELQTIKLKSNRYPHYLRLRITGRLDGQATITDPWGNATIIGPGNFELYAQNEWYEEQASLNYSPTNVMSGFVTIHYKFEDGY